MKRFLILLVVVMAFAAGCATTRPVAVVITGGKGLPPQPPLELLVYVWNETDYAIEVVLQRPYGGQKKIYVAGHDELLQPLTRGGDYRWFASASALGMAGEDDGSFLIVPGETNKYRGRVAGYHLVVKQLNWKDRPSRKFFSSGAINGEIRYGSREDTVRGSIAGVRIPARVELGGGFAVLNRLLTMMRR